MTELLWLNYSGEITFGEITFGEITFGEITFGEINLGEQTVLFNELVHGAVAGPLVCCKNVTIKQQLPDAWAPDNRDW
jgi:hypothetical protein